MARFDNIKVGDLVLLSTRYMRHIATVEHVTATQFVAEGVRYTKHGRKVGESRDAWSSTLVQLATPKILEDVQAERAYQHASSALGDLISRLDTARSRIKQDPDRFKRTGDLEQAAELLRQAVSVLETLPGLEQGNG